MKQAIGTLVIHGTFWALPVVTGGLANVLGMAAWGLAVIGLLVAVGALMMDRPLPKGKLPAWRRRIQQASFLGIVVWLAWWGYVALPVALVVMAVLIRLKAGMDKEAA